MMKHSLMDQPLPLLVPDECGSSKDSLMDLALAVPEDRRSGKDLLMDLALLVPEDFRRIKHSLMDRIVWPCYLLL
jgi:hypothetical protein